MIRRILRPIRAVLLLPLTLMAEEIDFLERFALADDRAAVLSELVPGTEDFYLYHAIHAQTTGDTESLESTLEAWKKRHPRSEQRKHIEDRQALLDFSTDPKKSVAYLRKTLNLKLDHQRPRSEDDPSIPDQLDPALVTWDAFAERQLQNRDDLKNVTTHGLGMLAARKWEFSQSQRRDFLNRITRPDVPGLVDLIVGELEEEQSNGFGSLNVHHHLTRAQLDALAEKIPSLRNEEFFVKTYMKRLLPDADTEWQHDTDAARAYLEEIWKFAEPLSANWNALKAHVLHERLVLDHREDKMSQNLLLEYLKLPRVCAYARREYLDAQKQRALPAVSLPCGIWLPPWPGPSNYDQVVRDYMLEIFRDASDYKIFAPYVDEKWLRRVFAESKITNGIGNPEEWAAYLSPSEYQRLIRRVDIDLDVKNPAFHRVTDEVKIAVHLKNVPQLIVKVYELNPLNYYLQEKRQINTDINLDGLMPNEELTFKYEDAPARRMQREFTFPKLASRRGVWVVEFLGNGRSSRALIRKGQLSYVRRVTADGVRLHILDESDEPVKNPVVWLGNREIRGENGVVRIPFSTSPGTQPLVMVADDGFAALEEFDHPAETPVLNTGFLINREQAIAPNKASLLVRNALTIAGAPAPLSLLEKPRVTVFATTEEGATTSREYRDLKTTDGEDLEIQFQVPNRLKTLRVVMEAEIKIVSEGDKKIQLVQEKTFGLNGINESRQTSDFHLAKIDGRYFIEWLGRNGEPRSNRSALVKFQHKDFTRDIDHTLRTNERGRILLGALTGIAHVKISAPDCEAQHWYLRRDEMILPSALHGVAGETLRVPWVDTEEPSTNEVSLFELRGNAYYANAAESLAFEDGFLVLKDLRPGDYELHLKNHDHSVAVRVARGQEAPGVILGRTRYLEVRDQSPLHISGVDASDDAFRVQLANTNAFTRVHVMATRYRPPVDLFEELPHTPVALEQSYLPRRPNIYMSGRKLGDEHDYIINRRYTRRYPGNMLTRPGILLNPWDLRDTSTQHAEAAKGENYQRGGEGRGRTSTMTRNPGQPPAQSDGAYPGGFPNYEFFRKPGILLANLKPDENGVVELKTDQLGDRQFVHILAVDPESTVYRHHALPDKAVTLSDRRFAGHLDPLKNYTERTEPRILDANETLDIEDMSSSELTVYDTLGKVYNYFLGVNGDATLQEFQFILRWPSLGDEEKKKLYSKYACHELSFFLSRKDPGFFKSVVRPYLANKHDRTFLDDYLIEEDLHTYLESWPFGRLNAAERALLARRLGGGDQKQLARHLQDILDLVPVDEHERQTSLASALLGQGLAEDRLRFSINERLSSAEEDVAFDSPESPSRARRARGELKLAEHEISSARALPQMAQRQEAAKSKSFHRLDEDGEAAGAVAGKPVDRYYKYSGAAPDSSVAAGEKANKKLSREALKVLADTQSSLGRDEHDDGAESAYQGRVGGGADWGFYRKLKATKEWAENNYHHVPIEQQVADHIRVNPFWRDYATWNGEGPFLSAAFTEATQNFSDMMLALSVLDLPFDNPEHDEKIEDGRYHLQAKSGLILFHREVRESPAPEEESPLLVSQSFFRHGDRYRQEGPNKIDKFVTQEFLTGVVYSCEVAVTNPTGTPQALDVLLQIPARSIPVMGSRPTNTVRVMLEPYNTKMQQYHFYFPEPGEYTHLSAQVGWNDKVLQSAKPMTFRVVKTLSESDSDSWPYLARFGSDDEVLDHLQANNIEALNLDLIAWRLRDPQFFESVFTLLRGRQVYHPATFAYGFLHAKDAAMRQFLLHQEDFLERCGPLECALVNIKPVERHWFQHLEYDPLVNARRHQLGDKRKILNPSFHEQYHKLLGTLAAKADLNSRDRLAVSYYLFLQDRVAEALRQFDRIDANAIDAKLQYDYVSAYAAFCREEPARARTIARRYAEYPVDKWRERFALVTTQVAEIDGGDPVEPGAEDREGQQDKLASTDPSLQLTVDNQEVRVHHENITELTIRYYEMDIEFLFSSNPFVSEGSDRFRIVKPNHEERREVARKTDESVLSLSLPDNMRGKNVLVEVSGGGRRVARPVFSNNLDLALSGNYGRLQLRTGTDERPLSKAYVKVYARHADGQVRFYKDGYTDLRGKFDYASLSTGEVDQVRRFSLLVMSDDHGALVTETTPPQL